MIMPKVSSQFTIVEWIGFGLVIIQVLILLGFPAISQHFVTMYDRLGAELPLPTKFVAIPWAPQMIGVFLAIVLAFQWHDRVKRKLARIQAIIGFLFLFGTVSIAFCVSGLYAPTFTMIAAMKSSPPPPDSPLAEAVAFQESEAETSAQQDVKIEQGRKTIKEGRISFESPNLSETRRQIDEAVKKFGGYIAKESQHNYYEGRRQQNLIIRVPAENFDNLLAEISQHVEQFDGKHITVKDVTEEYLDLKVRIQIKKDLENRYRGLLNQAESVENILAIEKQIGELQTDIESTEGRLKYLQDRIAYSTLEVDMYEAIASPLNFLGKFRTGITNGWNSFVWFLVGLVNVWPFLLIALVLLGIFGIWKPRRRGKTSQQAQEKNNSEGLIQK